MAPGVMCCTVRCSPKRSLIFSFLLNIICVPVELKYGFCLGHRVFHTARVVRVPGYHEIVLYTIHDIRIRFQFNLHSLSVYKVNERALCRPGERGKCAKVEALRGGARIAHAA